MKLSDFVRHPENSCVSPEVREFRSERSLRVAGVEGPAAEADGAAHHSGQSQDGQQDGPPMSLHTHT